MAVHEHDRALRHSDKPDAENQGSGVPNYLGALAISPDGTSAWVPSKQDNIARGTLRSGANLNFQNTVRAISSRSISTANAEDYARASTTTTPASRARRVYDRYGVYLFVALETSREVAVVDAHGSAEFFRIHGRPRAAGPRRLARRPPLFVNNFMDRTVGVYDLSALRTAGSRTCRRSPRCRASPPRSSPRTVLARQAALLRRARHAPRARAYMSCARCHNDGGHDGRIWDLTGMGEGLRNTISLRGRARRARLPRTGRRNFDEVQDFEGQIRSLAGGTA